MKTRWILFDATNGDILELYNATKIYFWEFTSRKKAMKFRLNSSKKNGPRLVGPFKIESGKPTRLRGGTYVAALLDSKRSLTWKEPYGAEIGH